MLFLRLLFAAASGLALYASYEPLGWGLVGIVGIAIFFIALSPWRSRGVSMKAGALIAFVQQLTTFLLLLPWIGEFVGAMPYVALAVTLAVLWLPFGALGAVVTRWRFGWLVFALVWVLCEGLRSRWPFGGFAWVRVAWGQINNPLANVAAWFGPVGVTLAAVAIGACVGQALTTRAKRSVFLAVIVTAVCVGSGIVAGVMADRIEPSGQARIAAIQGNVPRLGLDFNAQRRAVLANHVRMTETLADEPEPVDAVIWPENAADVNPLYDPVARGMLAGAVKAARAPILVGTIDANQYGPTNTMVVVDPQGNPQDRHDKKYLQPFGEYMPLRDLLRPLSHWVDRAGNFQPGHDTGMVRMGSLKVGIATCYEVIVDEAYRDAVKAGAEILSTPTNNATFGFTDMSYQQLAMSRMRAIETHRAVVVAATSGVSAMVHPDGSISQHTGIFQAGVLTETLPLYSTITPAVRYGFFTEVAMMAMGAALGVVALFRRTGRSRSTSHPRSKAHP